MEKDGEEYVEKYEKFDMLDTGLLRCSKMIYQEASSVLYSDNEFEFWIPDLSEAWLSQISPTHAKSIAEVSMVLSRNANDFVSLELQWARLLTGMLHNSRLKALRVDFTKWGTRDRVPRNHDEVSSMRSMDRFVNQLAKFREVEDLVIVGRYIPQDLIAGLQQAVRGRRVPLPPPEIPHLPRRLHLSEHERSRDLRRRKREIFQQLLQSDNLDELSVPWPSRTVLEAKAETLHRNELDKIIAEDKMFRALPSKGTKRPSDGGWAGPGIKRRRVAQ